MKKTPEEIEREIKAQEAELQKLLQESVGIVVFFRIFSFFEFAQHMQKDAPVVQLSSFRNSGALEAAFYCALV